MGGIPVCAEPDRFHQVARTVPIAINMLRGEYYVDWGAIMAAGVLVALPTILIFLLCNKYFIKGLAEGSVKG